MSIDWQFHANVDYENWVQNFDKKTKYKVIIILPGLGGSSNNGYIRFLSNYLVQTDDTYICGILNPRGSGFTELKTDRVQTLTKTSDWDDAFKFIENNLKEMGLDYNLYAIGMSIGSNILINYLGTYQTNLKAALTLNNPWDVNLAINMMRKSVVESFLTKSLSDAFLLRKGTNFT